MSAADVLRAALAAGVEVEVDGEDLVWEAPARPPDEVLAALLTHKREIVALLRPAPLVLRDGRCLHRFQAWEIPAAFDIEIIEMMDRARRCGAVLVADGMTLDVVEPRRRLMPEMLTDLQRDAGAVIAVLRGESRRRSRVISS